MVWSKRSFRLLMAVLVFALARGGAQMLEGFQWVDLHADQRTVAVVTRALSQQQYTALREIGYIGLPGAETPASAPGQAATPTRLPVPANAHLLVITAERKNPAALPSDDTDAVYDVDTKSGFPTLLLEGPGLDLVGWLRMHRDGEPELVATYGDCVQCQRTTFFTTFYRDEKTQSWRARWPRARAGAPMYSEGQATNGGQQVYALLDDETGKAILGTWQHFSGRKRRESDFVYEYLVDNYTNQEITQPLAGADARALENRLCHARGEALGVAGGQNSEICKAGSGSTAANHRSF